MRKISLNEYSQDTIQTLLSQIPFFNDLSLHDNQQYELLLSHSTMIELAAGEQIIRKGTIDKTFYFLLKGQLDVFPDENAKGKAINQLSPGQVFGAVAIINDQPRTASLAASKDSGATLFATDFGIFGELEDFNTIKLETKLSFLRIVVNNTRWKLEVYKMNDPDHPLATKLDSIQRYLGVKSTIEELRSLAQQSKNLGDLLNEWNASMQQGKSGKMDTGTSKSKLFSMLSSVRNSLS
jgi:CRP/FNR family transcriptional regulator, cyclic AMP receptor protein